MLTRRPVIGSNGAKRARDCGQNGHRAFVMQVRPPLVASIAADCEPRVDRFAPTLSGGRAAVHHVEVLVARRVGLISKTPLVGQRPQDDDGATGQISLAVRSLSVGLCLWCEVPVEPLCGGCFIPLTGGDGQDRRLGLIDGWRGFPCQVVDVHKESK